MFLTLFVLQNIKMSMFFTLKVERKLEPEPENIFPVPEPENGFPVPVPIFSGSGSGTGKNYSGSGTGIFSGSGSSSGSLPHTEENFLQVSPKMRIPT